MREEYRWLTLSGNSNVVPADDVVIVGRRLRHQLILNEPADVRKRTDGSVHADTVELAVRATVLASYARQIHIPTMD